jgi:hypothetical protein
MWVRAFSGGRQNATDQPPPGRPSATEAQVSSVATLLDGQGQFVSWPVRRMSTQRLHSQRMLDMQKITSRDNFGKWKSQNEGCHGTWR